MKKILFLIIASLLLVGCTPKVPEAAKKEELSEDQLMIKIQALEDMNMVFVYSDNSEYVVKEDFSFGFLNQNKMWMSYVIGDYVIVPSEKKATIVDGECVYDYKENKTVENAKCTEEEITNINNVVGSIEKSLHQIGYDMDSLKEVLDYAIDIKYVSSNEIAQRLINGENLQETTEEGKQQALKRAGEYLQTFSYSKEGLEIQLAYDRFTNEEANYAVENCGANWQENANKRTKEYLDINAYSYDGLYTQLIYEGFTPTESTSAIDALNIDWNEQAAKQAKTFLEFLKFTRSELIDQLIIEGFTKEQATYGADSTGVK